MCAQKQPLRNKFSLVKIHLDWGIVVSAMSKSMKGSEHRVGSGPIVLACCDGNVRRKPCQCDSTKCFNVVVMAQNGLDILEVVDPDTAHPRPAAGLTAGEWVLEWIPGRFIRSFS